MVETVSGSEPGSPLTTDRAALLNQIDQHDQYDLAIIGGGATGLGVALDAANRGFKVLLVEAEDFAKGTSSRSTKLLHGGVRYLAQGDVPLVREALHERSAVMHNAPHLAQPLAFLMPCYRAWQVPFYWTGLKLYDALSGKHGLGPTQVLSSAQTQQQLPNVWRTGLKGAVKYWDGQFDDARLALAIARTAATKGAHLINHCRVTEIHHESGRASGLVLKDAETGRELTIKTHCLVNATGVWVDQIRADDDAASQRRTEPMVAPSQGLHVVVDRAFMPGDVALIVPKTSDGRVLFAVPWLGKVILGTTDTPRPTPDLEPKPFKEELDFILHEAARHLQRAPGHQDIRSLWVGLRPLVKPADSHHHSQATKRISREHTIVTSASGMVTVTGGKWTTYRVMAHDTLAHCFKEGLLAKKGMDQTAELLLVGAQTQGPVTHKMSDAPGLAQYGDEQSHVQSMTGARHMLAAGLSEAMVSFAARYEYARTVEDVLARRHRLLFLDAAAAQRLAPVVGEILQSETGQDPQTEAFVTLAQQYQTLPV